MSPKQSPPPLVVIAVTSETTKLDTVKQLKIIGQKWREDKAKGSSRDVVFAYMDVVKWGKWLKGMYGITNAEEAEVPPIVIADHTVSNFCHHLFTTIY